MTSLPAERYEFSQRIGQDQEAMLVNSPQTKYRQGLVMVVKMRKTISNSPAPIILFGEILTPNSIFVVIIFWWPSIGV